MRSARRLAQQAQCGSGHTSQTTSASQPAKRPMLHAMSAERYMPQPIRKTRATDRNGRGQSDGDLAGVRGGDRVAQREAAEVERAAHDHAPQSAVAEPCHGTDVLDRADTAGVDD